MRSRVRLMLAALALVLSIAGSARAQRGVESCLKASEQGQRLRDAGRYAEARALWSSCASSTCPALVQQDCGGWLAELDKIQPSVVFVPRSENDQDVVEATIAIDGTAVSWTPGRPVLLDPGPHRVSVAATGYSKSEQQLVVNTGEKNRLVVFRLAPAPTTPVSTPAPDPTSAPTRGSEPTSIAAPPPLTFVLGGLGAVALGGSLFFGLSARSDFSAAERAPCAATKSCDPKIEDQANTKLIVADVLAIGGVVAIGAGIAVWILSPRTSTRSVRVAVRGTRMQLEATF